MFTYFVINSILVVLGGAFLLLGLACAWVSLGSYKRAADKFGIWFGIGVMVLGIGLWYISGSIYPEGYDPALLGE